MNENIPITVAYAMVAELAHILGVKNLNQSTGCWEHQIDQSWTIRLNPHQETIDGIGPFEMAISFNGWPAGLIHPTQGGIIAVGSAANENTFIAAVDTAIERAFVER